MFICLNRIKTTRIIWPRTGKSEVSLQNSFAPNPRQLNTTSYEFSCKNSAWFVIDLHSNFTPAAFSLKNNFGFNKSNFNDSK